jgi:RimJ/RimL family protein N-acetyltransferase
MLDAIDNFTLDDLKIRLANNNDAKSLFEWFNSSDSMKYKYITKTKILFIEHKKWFECLLKSSSDKIFIIEKNGLPIGNIRLKVTQYIDVDIYIINDERKKGYAKLVLSNFIRILKKIDKKSIFEVLVSKVNLPSLRLFKSCGFKVSGFEKNFYKLRN